MSASYHFDRKYSDSTIDQVSTIIGPLVLVQTPDAIDRQQGADLMVCFTTRDPRIAVRVRRNGVAEKYPFQFTVRSKRDNGAETEYSKIIKGWGDWLFYGHHTEDKKRIHEWWLIDLDAFRHALIRQYEGGAKLRCGENPNGDGTHFRWFDLRSFSPSILIASSRELPQSDEDVPEVVPAHVPDAKSTNGSGKLIKTHLFDLSEDL